VRRFFCCRSSLESLAVPFLGGRHWYVRNGRTRRDGRIVAHGAGKFTHFDRAKADMVMHSTSSAVVGVTVTSVLAASLSSR
jgi:hypothetical protein